MKEQQQPLSPLDIVILLKLIALGEIPWLQSNVAEMLHISQSEVSKSFMRSKYAGLLDASAKKVSRLALMEFLQYGIRYVYPQQPGALVRGIATAHSAPPLNATIISKEPYVWPSAKGNVRGQSILPLYPSVVEAVKKDDKLYELLALVDAIRVGRAREKEIAVQELRKRIVNGE
jgi:DNA-binding Lrp family transcriptional regulator